MKKNEKKFDLERETRVLLEDVRHGLKTVAEGHGSLARKLDDHDKKFVKIESDLVVIKTDLRFIKSELGSTKSELGSVQSELHSVKAAVFDTNHRITDLQKTVSERFEDNEKRINRLENKVFA